jgi:Ser/Thr protein kinase RdoA (MazF antagonist)
LDALARDTDILVPRPCATRNGALRTSRWSDDLGREIHIVLMSWLPGRQLSRPGTSNVRELGRVMAKLHRHAATWDAPHGAAIRSHASVLVEQTNRLDSDHPLLTPERRRLIDRALDHAQTRLDELHRRFPTHALHSDLHFGNVKADRGGLVVFDFDDAVIGPAVLDLGISTYYLRGMELDEQPLVEGYASVQDVPPCDAETFEALLVGRNLLLLNEMLGATTAPLVAALPRYIDDTMHRLQAFFETGTYRLVLPGGAPWELATDRRP